MSTLGPAERPRVAVVVVTYNSADVLQDCLLSLVDSAPGIHLGEIIIADNASTDATVRIAERSTVPAVRIVQVGRNAGYAAGVNAGIDALHDDAIDAVLVLNPDCRLRPGSVRALVAGLRRRRCAISVPKLLNPDGTLQPSLRRDPTVRGAFAEALIGGSRAGRAGATGELVTDPHTHARACEAAWATGAAMLISMPAIRELGALDESFFLFSEETEYMMRAREHGWHVWYEPAAVIEHIGGDSPTNPALSALITVNKVRLFRRRNGRFRSLAYYLAMVFGQALRAAAGRPTARASLAALTTTSGRMRLPAPDAPSAHAAEWTG